MASGHRAAIGAIRGDSQPFGCNDFAMFSRDAKKVPSFGTPRQFSLSDSLIAC
jgi:hypothetical protein